MPSRSSSRSAGRGGRGRSSRSRSRSRGDERSSDSSSSDSSSGSTDASSVSSDGRHSSRHGRKSVPRPEAPRGRVPTIVASVVMAKHVVYPIMDVIEPRLEVRTPGWGAPVDPQAVFAMTKEFEKAIERHYRNKDGLPKDGQRIKCEFHVNKWYQDPQDPLTKIPEIWQFKRSEFDPEPGRFGGEERRTSRSSIRDRDRDGVKRRSGSTTRERRSEDHERRSRDEDHGGRRSRNSRY